MQKPSKLAQTPQIRFAGFTDPWERRKLSEICQYRSSSLTAKDISDDGNYDLYDANSIIGKTNKEYMKTDYITIIKDGAGVGRTRLLPKNSMFLGTMGALTSQNSDLNFLYQLITNANLSKEYSGSTIPHIYFKNYGENKYYIPSLQEQQKIGELFANLDNLITLHQSKFEKLQKIKKSCLQNLFPQNNQNTPKIRFKNFSDEWVERKADEICTIETGKSNTQDQNDNGKYPFYIRSDKPVRSNKFLYDCEAVITIGDGSIGKVFHYVKGKFDLHQRCYKMTDFKDVTGKYFYYYFSTKFYDRAMKMTAKATVDSVRLEMISDMFFSIPNNLAEQCKISEFFTKFDKLITLQQRKVEKLKDIKAAMLSKAFI